MPSFGMLRSCWVVFGFVLLPACAQPPRTPVLVITGGATDGERIALPPQAVFEASMENVARADAASTTLGRARIESPRVPLRFSIPVDAAHLQAAGRSQGLPPARFESAHLR
jgi:putative lipoprotein